MTSRRYQTCGKYDGTESAGRWLRNLSFDLEEASVEETPKVFFQSIDLNFVKEPAKWLDGTPQFRRLTEMIDEPTEQDVEDFKRAFKARFSDNYGIDLSEDTVQEDTNSLSQGARESLLDYYGRAQHLLRRSHTRDAPTTGGEPLKPIERMVVNGVIKAFIRGIRDDGLKKALLMRTDKLPVSLLEAYDTTQQMMRRLEQLKEFEMKECEKFEIEFLRRDYAERHGRTLRSVLAEMGKENQQTQQNLNMWEPSRVVTQWPKNPYGFAAVKPEDKNEWKPGVQGERALIKKPDNQAPYQYRQQQGKGGYLAPNSRPRDSKTTPPRELSRHPIVNGSKPFDRNMGDLCMRCGEFGHRKPSCRSNPIEVWEQNYLRDIIYQGVSTNCAGLGIEGNNLRYKDIDSSNWRGRDLGISGKSSVPPSDQEMLDEDREMEDDNKILTCEEYDGVPLKRGVKNSETKKAWEKFMKKI
ncbi:hypothetical protein HI914_07244 [Erysiphe necator]|nr:hypothetical protein HI914_07244 [Erysiphe necator]